MEGLISLDGYTIILTICNMLILFYVLKRILFEKVRAFSEKRRNDIVSSMELAEKKNAEADEKLAEYGRRIANAQAESKEIVDKARQNAQVRADEILEQAQHESVRIKERALKDIELEKEKALRSLKGEVADMAVLATEKLIGKSIDRETNKSLIDEVIDEIGEGTWSN